MTINKGNRFLSNTEQVENANYVLSYLTAKQWDKAAICAMLGNMQTESTINPGIYQGLDANHAQPWGFGIVQWTPWTKLTDWLDTKGYAHDDMDGQLERIIYEKDNGLQWIANGHNKRYGLSSAYDFSFSDFIANKGDIPPRSLPMLGCGIMRDPRTRTNRPEEHRQPGFSRIYKAVRSRLRTSQARTN